MLTEAHLSRLLAPFGLELAPRQGGQLLIYLDLLMRWNRHINLTAIRTEEGCVTRHFAETLYLARWAQLEGRLLDIGSGAGFPGLALKIAFPSLAVTLLEPVAKKRAFLKEVARACQMEPVEVRGERLEDAVGHLLARSFEIVTSRAVGKIDRLLRDAVPLLTPGGRFCLWLTNEQGLRLAGAKLPVSWGKQVPIPLARQREIWVGTLAVT
jgi:16S rRNA (guanine527-N7)-methyltransferase